MPIETLSDRVRQRLREEMHKQKVSQYKLADLLGGTKMGWSRGRIVKILTGRSELRVDDLAAICYVLDLNVVEAVRDRGLEFVAEMTPSELELIKTARARKIVDSLLYLLGVRSAQVEGRGVTKSREGRIRNMR